MTTKHLIAISDPDAPPQFAVGIKASSKEGVADAEVADGLRNHFLERKGYLLQHVRTLRRRPLMIFQGLEKRTFCYHPTPKNASTTIKFALADMAGIARLYEDYDDIPLWQQERLGCFPARFHRLTPRRTVLSGFPKTPIHEFLPADPFATPQEPPNVRFCVVRDPVRRCLSMYSNRLLFHRERPPVSFDAFVDSLDEYERKSTNFKSQVHYLGKDSDYYTHIFTMDRLRDIADLLSELLGKRIELPHLQKGGGASKPVPSEEQVRKIREFYAEDYDVFGKFFSETP